MDRSELYQQAVDKGLARNLGIAYGVGFAQGWMDGTAQSLRDCILRIGTRRLGPLEQSGLQMLKDSSDPILLERIRDAAYEASDWAEVMAVR